MARNDGPAVHVAKALADGHGVCRAVLEIADADGGIVQDHRMVTSVRMKDDIVFDVAPVFRATGALNATQIRGSSRSWS